jgi:hypothetical protein
LCDWSDQSVQQSISHIYPKFPIFTKKKIFSPFVHCHTNKNVQNVYDSYDFWNAYQSLVSCSWNNFHFWGYYRKNNRVSELKRIIKNLENLSLTFSLRTDLNCWSLRTQIVMNIFPVFKTSGWRGWEWRYCSNEGYAKNCYLLAWNQAPPEDLIHVIVKAPDFASESKI